MRVIGRLLLILAVALPVTWIVAIGVASGDSGSGPAVMKCMHWKDDMFLTPGATQNPSGQQVTAKGKLYGCNKAGGGAVFTATLSMSNATCSNLAMSGNAQFDWVNGSHSSAFLNFQPQALEPNKVFIGGTMTSGAFQGLIVRAWLRFTQVFSGSGANCTANNPLKKIDFTNSQSFQLLTPNTKPSNPPPPPNPPPTNPPPHHPPPKNPPPDEPAGDGASGPAPAGHHHQPVPAASARHHRAAALPDGNPRVHRQQQRQGRDAGSRGAPARRRARVPESRQGPPRGALRSTRPGAEEVPQRHAAPALKSGADPEARMVRARRVAIEGRGSEPQF